MKQEHIELRVPGQVAGAASMNVWILNNISVDQGKRRPVILICPGGAYSRCSDREGEPVAMQFLAMGYHVAVLEYSVAPDHFPTSLLELAEAAARIRERAEEWHVDPERLMVCGFSAGGHLACSLGAMWNRKFVFQALGRGAEELKPNGMILGYPVITSGKSAHRDSFTNLLGEAAEDENMLELVSLEKQVGSQTPSAFIWHTYADQSVPVENSLLLAMALRKAKVKTELHIYPDGIHGLSLANEETAGARQDCIEPSCQSWITLVKTWLETQFPSEKLDVPTE